MSGEPSPHPDLNAVRMELRAVGERAVLVGHDGSAEREVDPGNLALDGDLSEALHEWARVAAAVQRSAGSAGAAAAVVSRRGLQLATRLAAIMGGPVGYVDPVTGEVSVVGPPSEDGEPARGSWTPELPAEPVPWLSGLTVSVFILMLVLFAVLTLAITLGATSPLLAVGSNVVVSAGLLPSVWLVRHTPIWRWIALGVAAAIGIGWLALPFILLG
jgi:uncharacterized protein DUF2537